MIIIGAQFESFVVDNDGLVELGDKSHPPGRRFNGRDEQAVVATGITPDDGGARPSAEAVRLNPFGALIKRPIGWELQRFDHLLNRRTFMYRLHTNIKIT